MITVASTGEGGPPVAALTVFHDPACGLCQRFREWLEGQALWLPVGFVAYDSAEAERRFPGIRDLGAGRDCVVLADQGDWWQGADAWLVCLWATKAHRVSSWRLAHPLLRPVVRTVVGLISENRLKLSKMMKLYSERELAEMWSVEPPACDDGSCGEIGRKGGVR